MPSADRPVSTHVVKVKVRVMMAHQIMCIPRYPHAIAI